MIQLSYIPLGGVFNRMSYQCDKCGEIWGVVHDDCPSSRIILECMKLDITFHNADHANKEVNRHV